MNYNELQKYSSSLTDLEIWLDEDLSKDQKVDPRLQLHFLNLSTYQINYGKPTSVEKFSREEYDDFYPLYLYYGRESSIIDMKNRKHSRTFTNTSWLEYCNEKGITGFENKHGLAKEVSYLYFDIPTDEELFIREVPKKGKKHYLMDIHRLFRRIEVEQERLAEVSPYCVPGSDYCCSVEPCGIPEHNKYHALLDKLYNHQRSLACNCRRRYSILGC